MRRAPAVDSEHAMPLWNTFLATGDIEARNALVEMHLPWCRDIARGMYARRGGLPAEFLEYVQLATLGLIDAIDFYDPLQGANFEVYALPRIRGAILTGLRSMSEKHEQVSLQKRLRKQRLHSLHEKTPGENRSEDLFEKLARVTVGFAIGYMLEGTNIMLDRNAYQPVRRDLYDSVEIKERREILKGLVDMLPVQERRVLQYHYYQGLAFKDVADLLDLTKGRVSQIHKSALEHIRDLAKLKNVSFSA